MTKIDVAQVVAAAASSSLGILSLIILAMSFIAYSFFKGSGDRVKLMVFAPMLLAGIGFGVAVVRQGQAAQSGPAPKTDPDARADPQESTATGVRDPDPRQASGDVTGTWGDDDGFTYVVAQTAEGFRYEQLVDGVHAGSGQGRIEGRRLHYAYVDDRTHDKGTCDALLSPDGKRIDGDCGNSSNRWGFKIVRR